MIEKHLILNENLFEKFKEILKRKMFVFELSKYKPTTLPTKDF